MAISKEAMYAHRERYGVMYMITLIGSLLPVLIIGGMILSSFNSLATESEVATAIAVHNDGGMHPTANTAVVEIQDQLNNIEAYQIEARIESQLKLICENSTLRNALEPTIKQLIRDYNSLMPVARHYVRPPCIQLGVIA